MERLFVDTPSGQLVSAQHIVILDIEQSGTEDQERHAVLATLVNGDRQLLCTFHGAGSQRAAQAYLGTLLTRLGSQRFGPPQDQDRQDRP